MRSLVFALALIVSGCPAETGFESPKIVDVGDSRIAALWRAAEKFDRTRYGFSPLPTGGQVGWEVSDAGRSYDAMLHSETQPYRTIAFRRTKGIFRWIGEQETFLGEREYETVDGLEREQITITYEIEPVSGVPLSTLSITYLGPDDVLMSPEKGLTLAQVQPPLRQWGY